MVIDADGLNIMAGSDWSSSGEACYITPHPGEMARLTGKSVAQVQEDRVGISRHFAKKINGTVILKGNRTLIAGPDGEVLVNPTGSPAMATGGTGDILTGMIAGFLAQFNENAEQARAAVAAAVYLHGLAGEIGAGDRKSTRLNSSH